MVAQYLTSPKRSNGMKIFNRQRTPDDWCEKVNFVDKNNVLVGYDMGQSCCEHADWFILDKIETKNITDKSGVLIKNIDLDKYVFDADFFEQPLTQYNDAGYRDLDNGELVVFKLVAKRKPDLYLHVYNCHNGYYGHGFEVKISGKLLREGCL